MPDRAASFKPDMNPLLILLYSIAFLILLGLVRGKKVTKQTNKRTRNKRIAPAPTEMNYNPFALTRPEHLRPTRHFVKLNSSDIPAARRNFFKERKDACKIADRLTDPISRQKAFKAIAKVKFRYQPT